MIETLKQPSRIIFGVIVVVLAGVFVVLGFWQLDRREQRQTENAVGESRISAPAESLPTLFANAGDDLETIEYRTATVTGTFDPSEEVLIRSQVELGQAGFHVITPLVLPNGSAVLVNRGWVPLSMDQPPVVASPPEDVVELVGWVHLTQERPPLGPVDAAGPLDVLNRVDVDRIAQQTSYPLAPVYLVAMGEQGEDLPVLVDVPDFSDEGPHLAYAIQWFGFAVIGVVGFLFLLRRSGAQGKKSSRSSPMT